MKHEKMRLTALDGLRGVAILLVIMNHVPLKIWYQSTPLIWHGWLDFLLANGKVGVSILFLLTGFLMAWLYPRPKSNIVFWSKRYARLFPAFLVMVSSWTIIKMNKDLSILSQILIVLGCGVVARIVWELFVKIDKYIPVGKFLTYFWIFLQISVAGWYVFYLLKIPSPVFYQTWNNNLQWLITGIVNATLTLPFGNYIGQLDGVYWSLITETFFYILYPVLFFPIIHFINQKKSTRWKTLLFISSFLFCYGLNFVSQRVLSTRMMIPYLMIYFIVGVVLGSNIEWWQKIFLKLPKVALKPIGLVLVLLVSLSGVFVYPLINKNLHPLVQMFLAVPIGVLTIVATLGGKSWGKYLENKYLVFLGKYSYSLYLTHALVIDLSAKIIEPNSIQNSFVLIFITMVGSIVLSWCLYYLIEAPYYKLPKVSVNLDISEDNKFVRRRFNKTILGFGLIIFLILILAFKTPFSLLTYAYPHQINFLKNDSSLMVTGKNNLTREFVAKENNLGTVSTNIKSIKNIDKEDSLLLIRFLNSDKKLISESSFDTNTMIESNFYPFGFPIQTDSKDKKYFVEYKIVPETSLDKVEITEVENKFVSVYFLNKNNLIKNTTLFGWWFLSKIREPFLSPSFWFNFILTTPLLLLLLAKVNKD